jgi:hypothetical protein
VILITLCWNCCSALLKMTIDGGDLRPGHRVDANGQNQPSKSSAVLSEVISLAGWFTSDRPDAGLTN